MSKDENPKERFGDAKAKLHLVPAALAIITAPAMEEGAVKYGPYNWRMNPVKISTYLSAIGRHLDGLKDKEWVDPESKTGKTHLGGIGACVAILADAFACGTLVDDREWPAGPAPRLHRAPGYPDRLTFQEPGGPDGEGPFALSAVERALELAGFSRGQADEVMRRLLEGPSTPVHSDIPSAVLAAAEARQLETALTDVADIDAQVAVNSDSHR